MENKKYQWYFSADPAFKTYGYAIVRFRNIDDEIYQKINKLSFESLNDFNTIQTLKEIQSCIDLLNDYFVVAHGGTVDLGKGFASSKISRVKRVILIGEFIDSLDEIFEKISKLGCPPPTSKDLTVIVEHQMGPNTKSDTPADLTINYFRKANIAEIGAGFKNKLRYKSRPDLDHSNYLAKYASNKTANKNHTTKLYFDFICPMFHHTNFSVGRKKDDFADAIIQILALRAFADIEVLKTKF